MKDIDWIQLAQAREVQTLVFYADGVLRCQLLHLFLQKTCFGLVDSTIILDNIAHHTSLGTEQEPVPPRLSCQLSD
jgi:hypothetical protein